MVVSMLIAGRPRSRHLRLTRVIRRTQFCTRTDCKRLEHIAGTECTTILDIETNQLALSSSMLTVRPPLSLLLISLPLSSPGPQELFTKAHLARWVADRWRLFVLRRRNHRFAKFIHAMRLLPQSWPEEISRKILVNVGLQPLYL